MNSDIGYGLVADVPPGWITRLDGRLIEIEPPGAAGSVFISVLRRDEQRDPSPGDALELVTRLPVWRDKVSWTEPEEVARRDGVIALANCVGPEGHDWILGALVASSRAVVFTFDSAQDEDPLARDQARHLFLTLQGVDAEVTERGATRLLGLATEINSTAREILKESGEHLLTAFVVSSDGEVEPRLLDAASREEVDLALSRLADEIAREQSVAVAVAGEAWAAPEERVPENGVAESLYARDMLIVVALDANGAEVAFETPFQRADNQSITLGETRRTRGRIAALDPIRAVWR